MTQRAYFFDESGGAPEYSAADFCKVLGWWRGEGVIPDHLNELEVYGDSSGMQIKVRSGRALLDPKGDASATGFYESDAEETLAIGAAHGSLPRIDRVVIRRTAASKAIVLAVLAGTPASSPSAPALTQTSATYEVSLAQVYVGAGVVTIEAANVTDERAFARLGMGDLDTTYATQADLSAHTGATSAHSAASAATANRIVLRDGAGRAKVAAPSASDDIARKDTVDTHKNAATLDHPDASVTTAKLAAGVLSADVAGRAKMADNYIQTAKIADAQVTDAKLATTDFAKKGQANDFTAVNRFSDGVTLMRPHRHPYANHRHIESGVYVNSSGSAHVSQTFTDPFSAEPAVVGNIRDRDAHGSFSPVSISGTGFRFSVWDKDNNRIACGCYWIAEGQD